MPRLFRPLRNPSADLMSEPFVSLASQPASREKQQHREPAGERRLAAHARLRPDRPSAGAESGADPPTSLQHGRLWYTGALACVNNNNHCCLPVQSCTITLTILPCEENLLETAATLCLNVGTAAKIWRLYFQNAIEDYDGRFATR